MLSPSTTLGLLETSYERKNGSNLKKRKNELDPSLKGFCVLEHRGISSAVNTTDPFQQEHISIVLSDKVHPFPDPLCKSLASRPHGRDPQLNVSAVVQKRTIVSTLHHETGAESP